MLGENGIQILTHEEQILSPHMKGANGSLMIQSFPHIPSHWNTGFVPDTCVIVEQEHQDAALRGGHVRNRYVGYSQCSCWERIPLLSDNTDVSKSILTSLMYYSELPEEDING